MNYNTNNTPRARFILMVLLIAIIVAGIAYLVCSAANAASVENTMVKCWIMCKPGKPGECSYVYAHRTPDKRSEIVGRLDFGDYFMTDAESKNGFIWADGIGEYGEAWIYCGYVVTEEPKIVNEQYVCVAKTRVACRRWMGGPKVEKTPWLTNGSNVFVYAIADGWAVTNRGYIKSEWLEVDPE